MNKTIEEQNLMTLLFMDINLIFYDERLKEKIIVDA